MIAIGYTKFQIITTIKPLVFDDANSPHIRRDSVSDCMARMAEVLDCVWIVPGTFNPEE